MYIPKPFAETNRERLFTFIQENSFATLISQVDGRPYATHIPFLVDPDRGQNGYLVGHMARANPHWQDTDQEVLVVFSGAHTYISPTWYEQENMVPTWNYLTAHVYGRFSIIHNRQEVRQLLADTVQVYEATMPTPWQMDMPPERLDNMINAIVGFEIEITDLQGKRKLNQNHPVARREKVIRALSALDNDHAQEIAKEMIETLNI